MVIPINEITNSSSKTSFFKTRARALFIKIRLKMWSFGNPVMVIFFGDKRKKEKNYLCKG